MKSVTKIQFNANVKTIIANAVYLSNQFRIIYRVLFLREEGSEEVVYIADQNKSHGHQFPERGKRLYDGVVLSRGCSNVNRSMVVN